MGVSLVIVWLALAVVLGVIELSTMGLFTIWFAIGAVASMLAALLGASLLIQLIVFAIVSALSIVVIRPWVKEHVNNKAVKTNIDAAIGRKLIVKTDIDNLKGTGKVDMEGSTWLAASSDDNVRIAAGEEVVVVKVSGAKLIVEREV